MNYFYTHKNNIFSTNLEIYGEEVAHIRKVLRHRVGDKIIVVDGEGFKYFCEITQYKKDKIICSIIKKTKGETEPSVKLTLFQAIPKGAHMDFIVEKAAELGVEKIVPMITDFSVCKPDNESHKKIRWQNLSISAMKQSKGCVLTKIDNIKYFSDAIKEAKNFDLSMICNEKEEKNSVFDVFNNQNKVCLFIGPEGGFSKNELNCANEMGIISVSLGKRRLRVETAAIVGCANIFMLDFIKNRV